MSGIFLFSVCAMGCDRCLKLLVNYFDVKSVYGVKAEMQSDIVFYIVYLDIPLEFFYWDVTLLFQ